MRTQVRGLAVALLVATLVLLQADAFACPNCKEAVTSRSSEGFGYAIYAMLGSVFSLAGGIVWMIVHTARRAAAAETTL